jgi:hypothetical protein
LAQAAIDAILSDDAEWFGKMSDAINGEIARNGKEAHPLHSAILAMTPVPCIEEVVHGVDGPGTKTKAKIYFTGVPVDSTPRLTIGEISKALESQGLKPANQERGDWIRTVRRACKEAGLPLVPLRKPKTPKAN